MQTMLLCAVGALGVVEGKCSIWDTHISATPPLERMLMLSDI